MQRRSTLVIAFFMVAILALCNALSLYSLSYTQLWRDSIITASNSIQTASKTLERYLQTGDPRTLEYFDQTIEPLLVVNSVQKDLFADTPDWEGIQDIIDTSEEELLAEMRVWRIKLTSSLPPFIQYYELWYEAGEYFDELLALREQAEEFWTTEENSNLAQSEELLTKIRDLSDRFRSNQEETYNGLAGISSLIRTFLVASNFMLYSGLFLLLGFRFRRVYRKKERETARFRKRLHDNQALYRAVITNSKEAICLLTPDSLEVVRFNPAFCKLLGYHRSEVPQLSLRDFFATKARTLDEFFQGTDELDQGDVHEAHWRTSSGEMKVVEVSAMTIATDSRWLLLVARDLSEKRDLDARLASMDRMAAVGILASGVGHEINNPMAYVVANLDFSTRTLKNWADESESYSPQKSAVVLEALQEAREGTRRVTNIVADLKDFSRWEYLESGETADLEAVLDSTLRMASHHTRHRAQIIRRFADLAPVEGSESRLAQVFLNLIINAAQAIPLGKVEMNEIIVEAENLEGEVCVRIRDTGEGIAPEDLSYIFDNFFSTKSDDGGTGLGLPICRHIVEQIGGRIDIKSIPGVGTTVSVWLNRAIDNGDDEIPPSKPIALISEEDPLRILVVDDEERIGKAISRLLDQGFDVITFTTGQKALTYLQDEGCDAVDIILSDMMMPTMTGIQFARQLGQSAPDSFSSLIFMTGAVLDDRSRRFIEKNNLICLDKPLQRKELFEAIDQQLATTLGA